MQQTLLAILAMALAVTFSYSNQVKYVSTSQELIAAELQEMGGAAAVEALEIVRARAYDQAILDGEEITDPGDFTFVSSSEHFATGRHCEAFGGSDECEAVEHFHKMQTAEQPFIISRDTFYFAIDIEVEYVDANGDRSSVPTTRKKVQTTVRDTWPDSGRAPFLERPVRLSRVFSYTS